MIKKIMSEESEDEEEPGRIPKLGELAKEKIRRMMKKLAASSEEKTVEQVLKDIEQEMSDVEEATGVSRIVEVKEARAELEKWIAPISAEMNSLVEKGAVEVLKKEKARMYLREHVGANVYPSKPILVRKKCGRLKCRAVVCGNFATNFGDATYSGTPDATAIRAVVATTSLEMSKTEVEEEKVVVGATDVSTAFPVSYTHLTLPTIYSV